jgi:hypothetical protein
MNSRAVRAVKKRDAPSDVRVNSQNLKLWSLVRYSAALILNVVASVDPEMILYTASHILVRK